MKFIGAIEKVVQDYAPCKEKNSIRLFAVMVTIDEYLHEQSIYVRIQGRNAQKVLGMMDESGIVKGLWEAEINVSVMEYEGTHHTIYANLMHCSRLTLIDDEILYPITEPELPALPLAFPAKSTGFKNWVKTVFSN